MTTSSPPDRLPTDRMIATEPNSIDEPVRVIDPRRALDQYGTMDWQDGLPVVRATQAIGASSATWLLPGLVDLYARLREPGATHKANIQTEARAALASGITDIVCAPDTEPCIDSTAIVELIRDRARQANAARVWPLAALSKQFGDELISEYASLRDAGCIAISNADHGVQNSNVLRRALQYAASFDISVHLHPIDRYLSDEGVAHDGRIAARLGLTGIPESAETLALARDLMLIEETGARVHISRISSARSVDMIRAAKARGVALSCDVPLANLFFCETDLLGFRANFHVRPPLRRQEDRDALVAGIQDGTIDAICSNHAPHDRDAKLAPFPMTEAGMSSIDALLPLSLSLVHQGLISATRWVELVSTNPARILGIKQNNWILLQPDQRVRLQDDAIRSAGKNTPFWGWEQMGVVLRVI
jgi:dihydroorotase